MSDKKASKLERHESHTLMPRPPYIGYSAADLQ